MDISTNINRHFAVCVNNQGYEAALEMGKLYQIVPDADATARGYMRVIDESGEDYAYTATRFYPVELPLELEQTLLEAA